MDAADRLFGEIAVELGHLSRDGLATCIRTQYDSAAGTTLSAIALSLGLMQQAEVDLVLLQQARGDRRKTRARAGIVEIDATHGAGLEERGTGRSASSSRNASVRVQSREAATKTSQPPVAASYRAPSNPKMPAVATREAKPAAQPAAPARRPDRTLIGTAGANAKSNESTPAHEAITMAPPPGPATPTLDIGEAYDASDDPEVSFEAETQAAPVAAQAVQAAAYHAPAGVGFRRRSTPPDAGSASSEEAEISFGALLSVPPEPAAEPARAPLGGTLHGAGAPKLATTPQAAAAPPNLAATKPPVEPELPATPPMVNTSPPVGTPPHGIAGARPRAGTLEFRSSTAPVEPPQPKTGSRPPRKPSSTIQHFRAVTPEQAADRSTRTTVGPQPTEPAPVAPKPTLGTTAAPRSASSVTTASATAPTRSPSVGWAVGRDQPLVVPSNVPTPRPPAARPPRRASAWFSSLPALASDGAARGSGLGSRVEVAAATITDAALAQLPPGAEPILFRALRATLDRGAHDLHLHRAAPIMMRLHGNLQPLFNAAPVGERVVEKALAQVMSDEEWQRLDEAGELVFSVELPDAGRARVSAYRSEAGCHAVVRVTPSAQRTLTDLGLPTSLAKLLEFESGLIICTGPIGSGVTTTIGALLAGVVTTRQAHIVTIEETIELHMPVTRSLISQRQLGVHVDDMARAVRAAAHEDVDLIAIGDLRNAADVALALSLAHGGHLVVVGAHARGAADCLNRLLRPFGKHDQGQARTMLGQSLRAVVAQELVTRADGQGRVPAIELIVATTAVSEMIRRGAPVDIASLTTGGKAQKLVTLADSLQRLAAAGTITAAEMERITHNRMRQA